METPDKEDIIDAAQILVIGRYAKEVLHEAKEDLIKQGKKELLWKALRGIEVSQSLARYFLVTTALFYGLPGTIEIKKYCAQRAAILVQDLFEFTMGIKYMKCYKNLPDSIKRIIIENSAVFIRQFKSQIIDAIPDVAPGVGFLVINYPSLTQGALHPEGAGMFTMPQTFGNIARMPMFTLALKSALEI